jgi:hypothetical protein
MKNIYLLLLLPFFSCSVINKAFHKTKTHTDSTSVKTETKDSTAEKTTVNLHKDSTKTQDETVIEFRGDTGVTITPHNPNDYFYYNPVTHEIRASKVPQKITIKGSSQIGNYDSLADHSRIELTQTKIDSVRVKSDQKEVVKAVHKTKLWWWLLLLIPAYLIYRNWPKIKPWIITILPI